MCPGAILTYRTFSLNVHPRTGHGEWRRWVLGVSSKRLPRSRRLISPDPSGGSRDTSPGEAAGARPSKSTAAAELMLELDLASSACTRRLLGRLGVARRRSWPSSDRRGRRRRDPRPAPATARPGHGKYKASRERIQADRLAFACNAAMKKARIGGAVARLRSRARRELTLPCRRLKTRTGAARRSEVG